MNSSRNPLSPVEKWLMFGVPALLLLLVGGALYQSKINAVPALVFPTPLPRPNPNGYDIYLAAERAIRIAIPPVDAVNDSRNLLVTNPKLAAKDYSMARKVAWLRKNAAGFALVQQALNTPTLHPDARGGNAMGGFGAYAKLRELARDKIIETHALTLQNRPNEAVHACLDTIQMGFDMARGGPLLGRLVGAALAAIGRSPLMSQEELPEHLDAPQARAAARRLEAILKRRPTFRAAVQEDRWVTLAEFLRFSQTPKWRNLSAASQATWREKFQARFLSKQTIVAQINRSFDLRIADLDKPWSVPDTPQPLVNPLVAIFCAPGRDKMNEAREIVTLDVLLLRFALRAYKLENGAYPKALTQLAPKYLQKVPTDYYADNAPFHYVLKGGDYELWSVGPDGKNDGGKPIPWRDGTTGAKLGVFPSLLPDSTGDYVARRNR